MKPHASKGVADKVPGARGKATYFHLCLQLPLSRSTSHCGGQFLVGSIERAAKPKHVAAMLVPTIDSGDPEDLRDVNSDDIETAGSSFSQESNHRLQKLWREGVRERGVVRYTTKKTDPVQINKHAQRKRENVQADTARLMFTAAPDANSALNTAK